GPTLPLTIINTLLHLFCITTDANLELLNDKDLLVRLTSQHKHQRTNIRTTFSTSRIQLQPELVWLCIRSKRRRLNLDIISIVFIFIVQIIFGVETTFN